MSYIYLASPYSHPDRSVRLRRYYDALQASSFILLRNLTVYSPIVHWHPVADSFEHPTSFDFWQRHNLHMLRPANFLFVLDIPGMKESVGVQWERDYARYSDIPEKVITFEELADNGSNLL